jgi:hypothetical protein
MGKSLACRVGWHKWVGHSTADGARFRQCARCGKDDDQGRPHPSAGLS